MSCLGRVLRLTMVSLCCNCCSNCPSSCPCWDHPLQRTSFSSHYNHPQSSSSFILQTAVSPLHQHHYNQRSANQQFKRAVIHFLPPKQTRKMPSSNIFMRNPKKLYSPRNLRFNRFTNSFYNRQLLRSHVVFMFIGQ